MVFSFCWQSTKENNACLGRNSPQYAKTMHVLLLSVTAAQLILVGMLVNLMPILVHFCIFFWLVIQQREQFMFGHEFSILC